MKTWLLFESFSINTSRRSAGRSTNRSLVFVAALAAVATAAFAGCGGSDGGGRDGGRSSMDGAVADGAASTVPPDALCITTARDGTTCFGSRDRNLSVSRTVESGVIAMTFEVTASLRMVIRMPDGASVPYDIRDLEVHFLTDLYCIETFGSRGDGTCWSRRDFDTRCDHVVDDVRVDELDAVVLEQSPSHVRARLRVPLEMGRRGTTVGSYCDCWDTCSADMPGMHTLYTDAIDITIDLDF